MTSVIWAAVLLSAVPCARGQMLVGKWVDQAQQRVGEHRKLPIELLVITSDDKPAIGATVHAVQQRHTFPFGFTLPERDDLPDPLTIRDQPLWRAINHVDLAPLTSWDRMQSTADRLDVKTLRKMVTWATRASLGSRSGPWFMTDRGLAPGWTQKLDRDELHGAIEKHLIEMTRLTGDNCLTIDVWGGLAGRTDMIDTLGYPRIRNLQRHARASVARRHAPRTAGLPPLAVRFDQGLDNQAFRSMVQKLVELDQKFVPIDMVSISQQWAGAIRPDMLEDRLAQLRTLGRPVWLVDVSAGGDNAIEQALRLETVLRLAFAEPSIVGITLANPAAEPRLLDEAGKATSLGTVADHLMTRLWHDDVKVTTDEIGRARLRLFAGEHRISATLKDGTTATTSVLVTGTTQPALIVLQPITNAVNGTNPTRPTQVP